MQKTNNSESKKILFVCLPSTLDVFKNTKISVAVPLIPLISIAQLSSVSRRAGYEPFVLDLSVKRKSSVKSRIVKAVKSVNPEYCGITFTTPLSEEADNVAGFIKKINPAVKIIAGGAHATLMPEKILESKNFDIVCIGEGEMTLGELLSGKSISRIDGLAFRKGGRIARNNPRKLIENLDELPMPDYSIFNSKDYYAPRITSRKSPVIAIETSRGCLFSCVYCSKRIFGQVFRCKSPKRVVDEMEHILSFGYKEIHVWDDGFSTDMKRAKEICREILRRNLKITWNLYNGIRANRIDKELLVLLKKAGCYRVSIGVESGNQQILDRIKKGIKVDDVRRAFKLTREVGIESLAFCMVGLPDETEKTMRDTINLMLEVRPSLPKLSIMMPLPGTPIFDEWDKAGCIISKHWPDYIFHLPHKVYNHPNLSWEMINKYYMLFYRKTMLNPGFLFSRLARDIKTGDLPYDVYYFIKTLKWGW
jgi:radical SAM superfamily enzyme YgiQ (UPF0313 family)